MKLKTVVQVMLVCGALALTSCASMHKKNGSDEASVSDLNGGGAQTSGVGDADQFGAEGNLSPAQLLARHTYYFEFDKSDVKESEKPAIFANADYLASHSSAKILLEGHTDPRGSREYNVALGERRGNAVAELLKSKGVNPDQIRVISYGAERLAAPGHDESAFQLDRRVVLVYLQK
jgi:peptidoglycan-associated lipoprotein